MDFRPKIVNLDAFKRKGAGTHLGKTDRSVAEEGPKQEMLWLLLAFVTVLAMTYLMVPSGEGTVPNMPIGSISPHNVKAPYEMHIQDEESTKKNKTLATAKIPNVFDYDEEVAKDIYTRIVKAFNVMGQAYSGNVKTINYSIVISQYNGTKVDSEVSGRSSNTTTKPNINELSEATADLRAFEKKESFRKAEADFTSAIGIELDENLIKTLRYYHYWPGIKDHVIDLLKPVFEAGIVGQKSSLLTSTKSGVTIRNISSDNEWITAEFSTLYDIPEAYKKIKKNASQILPVERPKLLRLITILASRLAVPNLSINRAETEARKKKASDSIEPVYFRVQRGEMIVREGELVSKVHTVKLGGLANSSQDGGVVKMVVSYLVLNSLVVALLTIFIWKYHPEIYESKKLHLFVATLLILHTALILASKGLFAMFLPQTPSIALGTYLLAVPLVFGPMIISIFFTSEVTVLFTIAVTVVTGMIFRELPILALMTLAGGMVCAFHVRYYSKRTTVIKVGMLISFANVIIILSSGVASEVFWLQARAYEAGFAVFGGVITAILVSAALPLVESFFPVVSDIKLLELTNLNHPLLRRMIMDAPGTYHHSIMVGNLAEEACKSIGANGLLARAGALFHDIGKMKNPSYFVENQGYGINPHDEISPSMSKILVINHIKQGQELAKEHKLLPQISAMIPEHHGTQLVKFFYHKAKANEDVSRETVNEEDFRYPGPVPQSRESAIVALADSLEASARACSNPTRQRLNRLVADVINDKFVQGQLDNSHLTLDDLAAITESFTHVLSGIHHHRLQYPGHGKENLPNEINSDGTSIDKTNVSDA